MNKQGRTCVCDLIFNVEFHLVKIAFFAFLAKLLTHNIYARKLRGFIHRVVKNQLGIPTYIYGGMHEINKLLTLKPETVIPTTHILYPNPQ